MRGEIVCWTGYRDISTSENSLESFIANTEGEGTPPVLSHSLLTLEDMKITHLGVLTSVDFIPRV